MQPDVPRDAELNAHCLLLCKHAHGRSSLCLSVAIAAGRLRCTRPPPRGARRCTLAHVSQRILPALPPRHPSTASQELELSLRLVSTLALEYPACVPDLLSIQVTTTAGDAADASASATTPVSWVHVASTALRLLPQLAAAVAASTQGASAAAPGGGGGAGSDAPSPALLVLRGVQHALALMQCMAEQHPDQALAALGALADVQVPGGGGEGGTQRSRLGCVVP